MAQDMRSTRVLCFLSLSFLLGSACGDNDSGAAAGDGGSGADGAASTGAADASTTATDGGAAVDGAATTVDAASGTPGTNNVKLAWTGAYAAYLGSQIDVLFMMAMAQDPKNVPIMVEKKCNEGGKTILKGTASTDAATRKVSHDYEFTFDACKLGYTMEGKWTVKGITEANVSASEDYEGQVKFTGFLDRTCVVKLHRMITAGASAVGVWTGTFCDEDVSKW